MQIDLLIEIGLEELPPKALNHLRDSFEKLIAERLLDLDINHEKIKSYSTPRRLAVLISNIAEHQKDQVIYRRGPSVDSAFDEDGNFTRAALGFARSCETTVESLQREKTEKGEWLLFKSKKQGLETRKLLPGVVHDALLKLPTPKRMLWGENTTPFVRPVHWLVVLLGNQVVKMELFGVQSGRTTRGHRFHHPEAIYLDTPDSYEHTLLDKGWVIADQERRKAIVKDMVKSTADSVNGMVDFDEELVDEVSGLVEWPVALMGRFEDRFLNVPNEALVSSMKGHQKYFPVYDKRSGKLLPIFISISNIDSKKPEIVIGGNERVIRPRLADAEFFWDLDRQQKLIDRIDQLRHVTYQKKLGSLYDKSYRVAELSASIAHHFNIEPSEAKEAAMLAKCDLLTEMVGEFPELQGIMGRYYALNDGISPTISEAIEQQYWPKFSGDNIPTSALGALIGSADRLDTLAGIFFLGSTPTGDKDPYALRRSALSVLRILIEGNWSLNLVDCINKAVEGLPLDKLVKINHQSNTKPEIITESIIRFMTERLKSYYAEQGVKTDHFEAARHALSSPLLSENSAFITDVVDFDSRLKALVHTIDVLNIQLLIQMNKRVYNILKKTDFTSPKHPDVELFLTDHEKSLYASTNELRNTIDPLIAGKKYVESLYKLAVIESDLVQFFDNVMVMDQNPKIRSNRLNLLHAVYYQLNRVVNLSYLEK